MKDLDFFTNFHCINCDEKRTKKVETAMDKQRQHHEKPAWLISEGWIEFYVLDKSTVYSDWIFFYLCPDCVKTMLEEYQKVEEAKP